MLVAIAAVSSDERLSTTITSLTKSQGRSARTRPIACASLRVGMITETRTWPRLPNQRVWPHARQKRIHSPGPPGAPDGDGKASQDGNQQLPDPTAAPF